MAMAAITSAARWKREGKVVSWLEVDWACVIVDEANGG